jgi:ABC-2 type transport system permease protein
MLALLRFELQAFFKRKRLYILLLLLAMLGIFAGSNFSLSVGPDVYKNAPYTIAFMTGFLSLFSILFSTILATQILFKEKENNFNLILYATPLRKQHYLFSRLITVVCISFLLFTCIIIGFAIGQQTAVNRNLYTNFTVWHYLQPLLVFGLVNTFFCAAIVCSVGWLTKNKVAVYITGLFIYILYMVMLIFSGSPLMAKGMPQSPAMVRLSACLDPFGLSAFFLHTSQWSVLQRNTQVAIPSGVFLLNRIGVLLVSWASLFVAFKTFSFTICDKAKKATSHTKTYKNLTTHDLTYKTILPKFSGHHYYASFLSFFKLDIKYIVKTTPFFLTCIALLFFLSMEMYGNIEKGIRLPQKYVTSGLMAKTIIDNFHSLCLLIILYYTNEICWRSRLSNFHLIEYSTPASSTVLFFSKWFTVSVIITVLTSLMIVLGITFQLGYNYPSINWAAYAGVYLFTSLPLIVTAGIILIIQKIIRYKYIGLIVSSAIVLVSATTLGKQLLVHPLLRFQIPYNGLYSDMNGYGPYIAAYAWRLAFGSCLVLAVTILLTQSHTIKYKLWPVVTAMFLMAGSYFAAQKTLLGYKPKNENEIAAAQINYEKKYRHFQHIAQPSITNIVTSVDLFPEKNTYEVAATYTLQNKTTQPIDSILINFADNTIVQSALLTYKQDIAQVKNQYSIVHLKKPLLPNDSAIFNCRFTYGWAAVNGHESFNAIVQNGSFMRISRYYPSIGYVASNELEHEDARKKAGLGKATQLLTLDAPRNTATDFINLNMTISTCANQTAIGVGELAGKWKQGNRNYFHYKTSSPIPFRFAVSSADYAVATAIYRGKNIEIYYHKTHYQNVAHLLKNIQLTLDYCETNFGPYPFSTIRFAEVSAFTRGFAATAYPATIYMTENMVFDANISSDTSQDVINGLAGHELAHIWWGNSQIAPDEREGAAMLTETLAMYTELMLLRKMHGKKSTMAFVQMHQGIYLDERGFSEEQPLYKAQAGNTHLIYSKGLVAMHQLTEMIGEETVNLALKNLLQQHSYPYASAVSTDFINALYSVTDSTIHSTIDDLFKRITLFDFEIKNTSIKQVNNQYALSFTATASKYYEDGKGNKSIAAFTDSIDIAVYSMDRKQTMQKLPVVNHLINGTILLHEKPAKIELDPDMKYLKADAAKAVKTLKPNF